MDDDGNIEILTPETRRRQQVCSTKGPVPS
jgi:hypothetical protein